MSTLRSFDLTLRADACIVLSIHWAPRKCLSRTVVTQFFLIATVEVGILPSHFTEEESTSSTSHSWQVEDSNPGSLLSSSALAALHHSKEQVMAIEA